MDLIETELMLCKDDDRICSCDHLVVADDDPRLFELGKSMIGKRCRGKPQQIMVKRHMLFSTVNGLNDRGHHACGLIWGADLEEYRLGGGETIREGGRVAWYDSSSIYGRPTIALLAPVGMDWTSIPKRPRVAVESRYERLSNGYLDELRWAGYDPTPIPWSYIPSRDHLGEDADLMIAQVDSPDIVERTGMWPIDRIWESEPMIITSP